MYEELINKKVKCVWKDGNDSKAVYGIVENVFDDSIKLITEKENKPKYIFLSSMISIDEVGYDTN